MAMVMGGGDLAIVRPVEDIIDAAKQALEAKAVDAPKTETPKADAPKAETK
jgi:hypothetical protein